MISRQLLIDSLNEVKQQALSNSIYEPDCGICLNWSVTAKSSFTYDLVEMYSVEMYSVEWEHSSLNPSFPVPHNRGYRLWEGVNLEMRLSLIDYLLDKLEVLTQEEINDIYDDEYGDAHNEKD